MTHPRMRLARLAVTAVAGLALAGAATSAAPARPQQSGASTGQAVSSVTTSGGDVVINGQPTLLFGMWMPQTAANAEAGIENLGVNLIIGTDPALGQPDDGIAAKVNGQAWVLQNPTEPTQANQLGVYLTDEPDVYGLQPSLFANLAASTGITFQNFTQHIADGFDPSTTISVAEYPNYLANLGAHGVASLDFYPVNVYSCSQQPLTVSSVYDYVAKLRAAVPRGMPVGTYIETGSMNVSSCPDPVTPTDITDEMRLAAAAGATVINPWVYSWGPVAQIPYDLDPANAAAVASEVRELQRYSGILLAPQDTARVSRIGDDLKIGVRFAGQGPTRTNYVIAVNGTNQSESWSGKLPGLAAQRLTSAIDGTTVQASGGSLSLTVPANSWQIYGYAPVAPIKVTARKLAPPKRRRTGASVRP